MKGGTATLADIQAIGMNAFNNLLSQSGVVADQIEKYAPGSLPSKILQGISAINAVRNATGQALGNVLERRAPGATQIPQVRSVLRFFGGKKKKMKGGAGSPPNTRYYIDPRGTIPELAEFINKTIDPVDIARIIQTLEEPPTKKTGITDYRYYLDNKDEMFALADNLKILLKEQYEQSIALINQVRSGNTSALGKALELADDVIGVVSTLKNATTPIGLLQLGTETLSSIISFMTSASFMNPSVQASYSYKQQLQSEMGDMLGSVGRTAGTVVGALGEAFGAKTLAQKNDPAIMARIEAKYKDGTTRLNDFKKSWANEITKLKKQEDMLQKQFSTRKGKETKELSLRKQYEKDVFFMDRKPESKNYVSFEDWKRSKGIVGSGKVLKSNKKQQTENALLKCMPVKCVSAVMKFYPK